MAKSLGKLDRLRRAKGTSSSLGRISEQMTQPVAQGYLERIRLDDVYPDPDNPRYIDAMRPSPEQVKQGEDALAEYTDETQKEALRDEIRWVRELAALIERDGQQQAIEVYADKGRYVIIEGENRWLACNYLGLETIDAKVRPHRPDALSVLQYNANMKRRGWPLDKRLQGIKRGCVERGVSEFTPQVMGELFGMNAAESYRWSKVLSTPDVEAAVLEKTITSLVQAYAVAVLPTAFQRRKKIASLAAGMAEEGSGEYEVDGILERPRADLKPKGRRGRDKRYVSFGRTQDLGRARFVVKGLAELLGVEVVAGETPADLQKAWKTIEKALDEKFSDAKRKD